MTTVNAHLATILTLLGIVFLPWLIGKVANIFIGDKFEAPGETWQFGILIGIAITGAVLLSYFAYTGIYACYILNYNN